MHDHKVFFGGVAVRCEDYPCCGHTDGDGCEPLETHTSDYWHKVAAAREAAGFDIDDPMFWGDER